MRKRKIEKSIEQFNKDVKNLGGYAYTNKNLYSAVTAGKKQSEGILKAINEIFKKPLRIVDVGSGDGTYTFELFEKLNPKSIVGFDFAKDGVKIAKGRIKKKDIKKIKFVESSIYDVNKKIKNKFDVAVVRGVLHHLYDPKKGINAICKLADVIVVVEPNGYSPLMKIMEKVSPYHRKHEEKSYWPPTLNSWFEKNGFRVKKQYFFGPVPFFFPETLARMIKTIEPFIENIPYINRIYCATNLIVYEK
jgi:2-polyprenyl-3-methyl-5-hydroxy-6-metoxy-1,4-benzoquinol methylase